MDKPLCIDLYCGLGGWAQGFLAEGWRVVGFDIERHNNGTGGYPGQLVIQDVLTLHGSQLRDAACIVASPPCQRYSYMAMPWKRAKAMAAAIRASEPLSEEWDKLNALFDACFRIQREASEAAGRYIPLIVENVKGAQPWVGRAKANYGSYYLWGDVAHVGGRIVRADVPPRWGAEAVKAAGRARNPVTGDSKKRRCEFCGYWFPDELGRYGCPNCNGEGLSGVKQRGSGPAWFDKALDERRRGDSRKAASAMIAKIPPDLASHIARCFKPVANMEYCA